MESKEGLWWAEGRGYVGSSLRVIVYRRSVLPFFHNWSNRGDIISINVMSWAKYAVYVDIFARAKEGSDLQHVVLEKKKQYHEGTFDTGLVLCNMIFKIVVFPRTTRAQQCFTRRIEYGSVWNARTNKDGDGDENIHLCCLKCGGRVSWPRKCSYLLIFPMIDALVNAPYYIATLAKRRVRGGV